MTGEPSNQPSWLRLEILSTNPDFDAPRLVELGALGVEVQDVQTFMEDAPFKPLPDGKTRLIAFFNANRSVDALRQEIDETFDDIDLVDLASYDDRSWETAWMDYFRPIQLSRRVTVGPPWDPPRAPANGLALTIEPGMAFGTGTHETTRLCASLLDDLLAQGPVNNLLDVGCGSAILSMLAAGLGVPRVVGIDVDDTAIAVARENIEKNGFSTTTIELSTTPLAKIDQSFDLVVANILAHILISMRDELLNAVNPGADLLLSGIADDQLDGVRRAFNDPRFHEVGAVADGEWFALHLRHSLRES